MMTNRDARSLSPEALKDLRRRAVAAVESGKSQTDVARLLGVSRKTVGTWVRAYQQRGDGAFHARTRGRRPGEQLALSATQQAWTVKTIVAGVPDDHGLSHALWSRQAVVELINREYRTLLSPSTAGQYLSRWGLINEPYLKEMVRERAPGIAPRWRDGIAENEKWLPDAEILCAAWTRPHAQTELRRALWRRNLLTGFRDYFGDIHVLQVISHRGAVFFQAHVGPFDSIRTERFFARLRDQCERPLNVIVHRWPLEHYEILRMWPQRTDRVALHY